MMASTKMDHRAKSMYEYFVGYNIKQQMLSILQHDTLDCKWKAV